MTAIINDILLSQDVIFTTVAAYELIDALVTDQLLRFMIVDKS